VSEKPQLTGNLYRIRFGSRVGQNDQGSGNFAIFAAIRRASSLLSLAAARLRIVGNGLYYLRSKSKGEKMLKVLIAGLFTLVLVGSATAQTTCPQGGTLVYCPKGQCGAKGTPYACFARYCSAKNCPGGK
jgi:hypothetical protein